VEGAQSAEAVIDNGEFGVHKSGSRPAAGPPGRRFRRRDSRRRDRGAVRDHGVQAAEGQPRLLPAHGGRGGADVRGGPDSRLVLPPGGPSVRGRDPHLPAHRPAAAPVVRQGPAQRDPDRRDDPGAQPRAPVRRGRDQRRVDVHPAGRPAVLRPDRRRPGRADQGPVGRVPHPRAAGAGHLRHGGRRPGARGRRRRHHDGRGRVHPETLKLLADPAAAPSRRPRRRWPRAWRRPSRSSRRSARRSSASPAHRGRPRRHAEYPVFVDYGEDVYDAVAARGLRRAGQGAHHRRQARPEAETDRVKALAKEKLASQFEGREKEISARSAR
jgi:hypothetical protein